MLLTFLCKYAIIFSSFLAFTKCSSLERENNTFSKLEFVGDVNATQSKSISQLFSQIMNWSKENEEYDDYDVVDEEDLEIEEEIVKTLKRRVNQMKNRMASIDYFLLALVEDVKQLDYMVEENRKRILKMWRKSVNNGGVCGKINWVLYLAISFVAFLII